MTASFRAFHLIHRKGDVPSRRLLAFRGSTTGSWTADENSGILSKETGHESSKSSMLMARAELIILFRYQESNRRLQRQWMCTSTAGCSFGQHQRPESARSLRRDDARPWDLHEIVTVASSVFD